MPKGVYAREPRAMLNSFLEKFYRDSSGCWLWSGALTRGYGAMRFEGRTEKAHRVSLQLFKGIPLRTPQVADHLCRNPKCVNPDHLEMVSQKENVMRGVGISVRNAAKTHCINGHALEGHNLLPVKGRGRVCRECANARRRVIKKGEHK